MVKRMLVDANHPEETRVVVLDGTRLEEFDVETSTKKQNKGNIYLAKVVRVEPSLQAAFVDYGGNRHGFLAFSEIHPDYYQIPVADREKLLAEVKAHDEKYQDDDGETFPAPDALPVESIDESKSAVITEEVSGQSPPIDEIESPSGSEDGLTAPISNNPKDNDELATESSVDESPENSSTDKIESETESPQEDLAEKTPDQESEPLSALTEDDQSTDEGSNLKKTDNNKPGVEEVGGEDETEESLDVHRRKFVASRRYKIQEVIKRRQILLVQVVKEERGTKGAALTTYLSLAGRYCVLMPNSARGGGVSRKITNPTDRRRLKSIMSDLKISDHMAVILRTAGSERSKAEVKRDYEYLQRTWNHIREVTMESRAPTLIHEEANLIKRSIRDVYTRDIEEILVEGEEGYKAAKEFMKTLTPSHAKKVKRHKDDIPLLHRFQVESQLDAMHNPTVQLKSGGTIVFGQTEALVAIDVNSGRATKERHIEETALKTNLEAATEIARQLRLRDLAGLVVIDFIDMDENRNNHAVERKLKEALKRDRARIQVGRISHFGLLELSRQRLRPSLIETNFKVCKACSGTGMIRSIESTSIQTLRAIEEEGMRHRSSELTVSVHPDVALYILNYKRTGLEDIEKRYGMNVFIVDDTNLIPPELKMDQVKGVSSKPVTDQKAVQDEIDPVASTEETEDEKEGPDSEDGRKRRRRRKRKRHGEGVESQAQNSKPSAGEDSSVETTGSSQPVENGKQAELNEDGESEPQKKSRRRGRRGGRGRRREPKEVSELAPTGDLAPGSEKTATVTEPIVEQEAQQDLSESNANISESKDDPIPVQTVPSIAPKPPSRFLDVFKRGAEALRPSPPDRGKDQEAIASPAPEAAKPSPEEKEAVASPAPEATKTSPIEKSEPLSSEASVPSEPVKSEKEDVPSGPPRRGWWKREEEN